MKLSKETLKIYLFLTLYFFQVHTLKHLAEKYIYIYINTNVMEGYELSAFSSICRYPEPINMLIKITKKRRQMLENIMWLDCLVSISRLIIFWNVKP